MKNEFSVRNNMTKHTYHANKIVANRDAAVEQNRIIIIITNLVFKFNYYRVFVDSTVPIQPFLLPLHSLTLSIL